MKILISLFVLFLTALPLAAQTPYAGYDTACDGCLGKNANMTPRSLSIAPDGSVLFIDVKNNWARRIDAATTIINNVMIAVNLGESVISDGVNYYVVERGTCRVLKVNVFGIASVFAGNGTCGYSGDGGPATSAMISGSYSIALASDGTMYLADFMNNRIRKIAPNGIISTFAGTGAGGFGGDGSLAVLARLNFPSDVFVDGSAVYIVDFLNKRVRKVEGGVITTVAGGGPTTALGDDIPGTSAYLDKPWQAKKCGNDLIINDNGRTALRKMNLTTNLMGSDARFSGLAAIACDDSSLFTAQGNVINRDPLTVTVPTATRTSTSVPPTPTRTATAVPPTSTPTETPTKVRTCNDPCI